MKNKEVSRIFREIAQILELKGENPFRIRAYEKAAQNVESLEKDIEVVAKEDKLTSIAGIGVDLAGKIKEIVSTGKLKQYQALKKEFPADVIKMLDIPGLGPKTVKLIYEKLKITTIKKLQDAAKSGRLQTLEGIREKTEENILRGIELVKKGSERVPLSFALDVSAEFLAELRKCKEIDKIEVGGSLRRRKDTIRDIDILVVSKRADTVMNKFVNSKLVKEVLAHGKTKSSVISKDNMQVDLRVVENKSFGSALLYFTGSKDFNVKFRQLAIKKGYKVNEYGAFKKEKYICGKTEEDIFSLMKMAYIPPELRENRGEIEAAQKNKLPRLVKLKDIKGDLHVHSKYSDGTSSIEEIAAQAQLKGYEYVAVTDHSQSLKVAGGMSKERVYKKIDEIKKVNKKFKKIKILIGTEIDILSDGSLDYPQKLLAEFDLVVAAIHSGFKQSKAQITKRLVSACNNKYVNIIAHPTGVLWGTRDPYDVDLEEVFKAARDNEVALEINCHPQRLDLNDVNVMKAKANGVKLTLGTDAHIIDQLSLMELGVDVARRGWLLKEDIINSMPLDKVLKWLKK
ncbi:MAG: DNA polymerase/3'-5' exonuclease PolX [Candidatus Omnitrophota bacterium]|nr:MAG: DNA polymerase/3'-5' exonuclease PolX [Candidatus Omnitrophota bacterium]